MNRQMKRAQERAEKQQKRGAPSERPTAAAAATRRANAPEKRKRTGARQFLREVRQELKKVDWPTRKELITYTVVVLVTITVLTAYVFVLDSAFERVIFSILD
jgi:preprotein translocase subunit SecE